jgi:hypothetical protein
MQLEAIVVLFYAQLRVAPVQIKRRPPFPPNCMSFLDSTIRRNEYINLCLMQLLVHELDSLYTRPTTIQA